jgi:hypothetical protein
MTAVAKLFCRAGLVLLQQPPWSSLTVKTVLQNVSLKIFTSSLASTRLKGADILSPVYIAGALHYVVALNATQVASELGL